MNNNLVNPMITLQKVHDVSDRSTRKAGGQQANEINLITTEIIDDIHELRLCFYLYLRTIFVFHFL